MTLEKFEKWCSNNLCVDYNGKYTVTKFDKFLPSKDDFKKCWDCAQNESQKELETIKARNDSLVKELEIWTSDDLTRKVVSRTINENAKLKARNKLLEDGIDFYADKTNWYDNSEVRGKNRGTIYKDLASILYLVAN